MKHCQLSYCLSNISCESEILYFLKCKNDVFDLIFCFLDYFRDQDVGTSNQPQRILSNLVVAAATNINFTEVLENQIIITC